MIRLKAKDQTNEDLEGSLTGPNVWLWYQVMRPRQTGVITAIESILATLTLSYSKSFQDASYSDVWTKCREQHTTARVYPGKAPPSHLTVSVRLDPSGVLRWHLEPLRGKSFVKRRSLSRLVAHALLPPLHSARGRMLTFSHSRSLFSTMTTSLGCTW